MLISHCILIACNVLDVGECGHGTLPMGTAISDYSEHLTDQWVVYSVESERNNIVESEHCLEGKCERLYSLPMESLSRNGLLLHRSSLKEFAFFELKYATEKFNEGNLITEGGFRPVFLGWLDEHSLTSSEPMTRKVVTVKMFRETSY